MKIKEIKQNYIELDDEAKIDLFCEQLKKLWVSIWLNRTNQVVQIWEERQWEKVIAPLIWIKWEKEDFIIISISKWESKWDSENIKDILSKMFKN